MIFPTPFGLYQVVTMTFGLHGVAATFQRLMAWMPQPHDQYIAAYIDDIVSYSCNWKDLLLHVTAVIQAIEQGGLKVNLTKCCLG